MSPLMSNNDDATDPYNLYESKPDFSNDYGWSMAVDENDYSPLKLPDVTVYLVNLTAVCILSSSLFFSVFKVNLNGIALAFIISYLTAREYPHLETLRLYPAIVSLLYSVVVIIVQLVSLSCTHVHKNVCHFCSDSRLY
ncbi:unnamed protein product [Cuscuta epithymum]|uniref:PRA1 family protein n=1 Tax=Cuscuta epithymum TaxID=186058 RepID=A0AAV0F408_9ASTE|nr:unnamed protein product [Cuscuta epithymum]